MFKYQDLLPYVDSSRKIINPSYDMKFVIHNHHNVVEALYKDQVDHVCGKVPLDKLVTGLTIKDVKVVAKIYNVFVPAHISISNVANLFRGHSCTHCETHTLVFVLHAIKSSSERVRNWYNGIDDDRKREVFKWKQKKFFIEGQKQQQAKRLKKNREGSRVSLLTSIQRTSKDCYTKLVQSHISKYVYRSWLCSVQTAHTCMQIV